MAKSEMGKIRLLVVYNMIQRGGHVTTAQIKRELELRYDISADRKTIYDDIRAIDRVTPIERISGRDGGFRKKDVLKECQEIETKDLCPCIECTRVQNPSACENKNCNIWRRWFLQK